MSLHPTSSPAADAAALDPITLSVIQSGPTCSSSRAESSIAGTLRCRARAPLSTPVGR